VLSDDPTRVAPGAIRNIQVEMTVVGGKSVFERHQ
jgi:predicted amidohydrolase YtcJ